MTDEGRQSIRMTGGFRKRAEPIDSTSAEQIRPTGSINGNAMKESAGKKGCYCVSLPLF
jgi:hypothetical protein